MKVFSLYFKIVKKNLGIILTYFGIFMAISFIFANSPSSVSTEFKESKTNIVFINNDEETALIKNLEENLKKYAVFKEVNEKDFDDALYFSEITHVIIIPKGFTNDFYNGLDPKIETKKLEDRVYNITIETVINKYLNLVKTYKKNIPNIDERVMFENISSDLQKQIDTNKLHVSNNELEYANFYFSYFNYILFAIMITIVGMINLKINRFEIKKRMATSPYTSVRTNIEILLGHFILGFTVTTLLIILSFVLYPNAMSTDNGKLLIINAYAITFPVLGIAYLISLLVKRDDILSAITNIVSLGSSFLSGAFVPQEFLSPTVLKFAHLLPSYYHIYNNNLITSLNSIDGSNLSKFIINIIIQFSFFVIAAVISLIISFKKQKQEQ